MGRPNISPRGFDDRKKESELLLLSSEPLGVVTPPTMEGPPLPEELPPRPFIDFFEEEAINGKQRTEEGEKEKKKKKRRRRKKKSLGLFLSNLSSVSWKNG